MAMKPTKKVMSKPVAKKTSVKPKASATSKPTVRGGPGTAGKNVSKGARNPTSTDKAFNAHKKAIEQARATYDGLKRAQTSDPLGRALKGGFGKYDKKFKELDAVFQKLTKDDNYFQSSGYTTGYTVTPKKKKK
jgi:hypothetical protein